MEVKVEQETGELRVVATGDEATVTLGGRTVVGRPADRVTIVARSDAYRWVGEQAPVALEVEAVENGDVVALRRLLRKAGSIWVLVERPGQRKEAPA